MSYYLGIWLCPRCLLAAGKHWMQTIYALEEKREGKIVVYKVGKKDCEKFSSLQYTFYESHEGHSFKISYKPTIIWDQWL